MEKLIKEYVDKLKEEDIKKFVIKKGITINENELRVIYMYIKNYWQIFLKGDPNPLFNELKEKLSPNVYKATYNMYNEYKSKF